MLFFNLRLFLQYRMRMNYLKLSQPIREDSPGMIKIYNALLHEKYFSLSQGIKVVACQTCVCVRVSWFFTCLHFISFAFQSQVGTTRFITIFGECNRYALNSLRHPLTAEMHINHFTERELSCRCSVRAFISTQLPIEQPSASDCLMKN